MAQTLPRFCPRCGASTVAGQNSCANCGLVMATEPKRTSSFPSEQEYRAQQAPQRYPHPTWDEARPVSSLTSSLKKGIFSRVGCVLILLLLLVVVGTGIYFSTALLGIPSFGDGGIQPSVTTTPMNAMVMYANVDITILNVQQSQRFVDDPNTGTNGVVRLHLREQNKTTTIVRWSYNDAARLILPGGTSVAPLYVKAKQGVAPKTTQTSIVDFAVPTSTKISQLTLRLGTVREAQMDIPLTGHADLSKYTPKTVNPSAQFQYFGLNWTLVRATSQLSIDGQQASKGLHYITVTLKVDNTLSQEAITGSPFDYIRLKSGNTTASPQQTTLPVSFDTGVIGKTGAVTFLMPQNSTAFMLMLLSQKQSGVDQVTTDFQIM